MSGRVCARGDGKAHHLHVVARLDGDGDNAVVIHDILRGRHVEVAGRDDRGGYGGNAGDVLCGGVVHRTAPGCNAVMDNHLRRICLLGTQDLDVDRNVIPVVAQHLVAVERNLVVVVLGGVAVGPRDDELHVGFHERTGLPLHGIAIEGLDLPDMGRNGVNRGIDRDPGRNGIARHNAVAEGGVSRGAQLHVVVLCVDNRPVRTVGFGSRSGHLNRLCPERGLAHGIDHVDIHILLVGRPLAALSRGVVGHRNGKGYLGGDALQGHGLVDWL